MIEIYAVLILAHLAFLAWRRGRVDPFDVRFLVDLVLFVMLVYAPSIAPQFGRMFHEDTLFGLVTLLGLCALYAGIQAPTRLVADEAPVGRLRPDTGDSIRVEWFILPVVVFIVGTLLEVRSSVAMAGGDFWSYFFGDRLSTYAAMLNDVPTASAGNQLIELTRPCLLVWMTVELRRRRWGRAALLYAIALVSILLIFRTRLQVLILLALPAFFWDRYVRRLNLALLAGVGIGFVALLYALNVWRSQGFKDLQDAGFSTSDLVSSVATNLNPVRGYELLWTRYREGTLREEHGYTLASVPMTAIPRALWPSKPILSFENRWTYNIFGEVSSTSDEGVGVWTFTVWGEGLTQFGTLGVALLLFGYGFTVAWLDQHLAPHRDLAPVWFYYSILAATYLRSSLSSLLVTMGIAFVPLALCYMGAMGRLRLFAAPVRT